MELEDLILGQEINKGIKGKIVCSHDIIQRQQMPFITPVNRQEKISLFGNERVSEYLRYTQYTKIIRHIVEQESKKILTQSSVFSRNLTITQFGCGECQELASLTLWELSKRGRRDLVFIALSSPPYVYAEHPHPYIHCLTLLGYRQSYGLTPGGLLKLNQLPDNVVAIDSYLNYVGPACSYLEDNQSYLRTFAYDRIEVVDVFSEQHERNVPIIEENIQKLLESPVIQKIVPHEFSVLKRDRFSLEDLEPHDEIPLISLLNQNVKLHFDWGHKKSLVHAYTTLHNKEEKDQALVIRKQLKTGFFYKKDEQQLFALHEINNQETVLPQEIHEALLKSTQKRPE
ncbi:hypothetical protein EBQ91_03030 [bacterium]|nr:hypothetical protein [bacterium]